jgi:hypothetical protein
MKDNRTVTEKFRDLLGLKQTIVNELLPLADIQLATSIVNKLSTSPLNIDNKLLFFLAQRVTDIVNNLKKLYKYGINATEEDADQFVNLIYKYYNENNNLITSTKQFLSRIGTNSTAPGQQQRGRMESQGALLIRLSSIITSIVKDVEKKLVDLSYSMDDIIREKRLSEEIDDEEEVNLLEKSQDLENRIDQYRESIKDINLSIISLSSNLSYILPKNPEVFDVLEKLLMDLEGTQVYEEMSQKISSYFDYINNNLPNLDFFGGLVNSLKSSRDKIVYLIQQQQWLISDVDIIVQKFIEILTAIYNQLNTGETTQELKKARINYDQIINFVNRYGSQLDSEMQPKRPGEEIEQIPASQIAGQPSIPSDFGQQQRDYIKIDEWPPFIEQDYDGLELYKDKYIMPLVSVVPDKTRRIKFIKSVEDLFDSGEITAKKLVNIKSKVKKYLLANKINIDKIKGIISEDSGIEPESTMGGYKPPRRGEFETMEEEEDEEGDDYDPYPEFAEADPFPVRSGENPFFRPSPRKEVEGASEGKSIDETSWDSMTSDMNDLNVKELKRKYNRLINEVTEPAERERIDDADLDIRDKYNLLRTYFSDKRVLGVGQGLKNKRMSGKGIKWKNQIIEPTIGHQQEPRYIKFGRFLINTKKLKDDVLSLRREKGTAIQNLPAYKMSKPFSKVINQIVGNGIPDEDDYLDLTDEEKRYLHKVSKESDLNSKIKIPTPSKDEDDKDLHLFNVYKGEIIAGNDSKQLITKFKNLMNKMCKKGQIGKKDMDEILSLL